MVGVWVGLQGDLIMEDGVIEPVGGVFGEFEGERGGKSVEGKVVI